MDATLRRLLREVERARAALDRAQRAMNESDTFRNEQRRDEAQARLREANASAAEREYELSRQRARNSSDTRSRGGGRVAGGALRPRRRGGAGSLLRQNQIMDDL